MPELPEVETVRTALEPGLIGKTILSAEIKNAKVIARPTADEFRARIVGQRVTSLTRRGKFLIVNFESSDRLVIHLRMTGQFVVVPPDYEAEKHTHLIMPTDDGNEIRYIDVRRFGRLWLLKADETDTFTGMEKLGLEPLDEKLTGDYLCEKYGKRKKPVKEMLLDQSVVAGVGNIYADEILFDSAILPEKSCDSLSVTDWNRLANSIHKIISWGIEINRMTPAEYFVSRGKNYRNIPDLKAYGREKQPCRICGETIVKVVIGGRSSCYCPKCQG